MKKYGFVWLLLIAVCLSGVVHAQWLIGGQKDKVVFKEQVLFGDSSVANGLRIQTFNESNRQLFWDTTYTIGDQPKSETQFRFIKSPVPDPEVAHVPWGLRMNFALEVGVTNTGGFEVDLWSYEELNDLTALKPFLEDVSSRTPIGESYTERIRIRDYFDFYPLNLWFDLPVQYYSNNDEMKEIQPAGHPNTALIQEFQRLFQIPVSPNQFSAVTIKKNSEGKVTYIQSEIDKESYVGLFSDSVVTSQGCYFVFSLLQNDNTQLEKGNLPGGYGIYLLPFAEENGVLVAKVDELTMVYALDWPLKVEGLFLNHDESQLILVSGDEFQYNMQAIDLKTMQQVQILPVFEFEEPGYLWLIQYTDELLLAFSSDERLCLITCDDQGKYAHQFTVPIHDITAKKIAINGSVVPFWDGEMLSLYNRLYDEINWKRCGFHVAVLSQDGLLYLGRYESSLDVNTPDQSLLCQASYVQKTVLSRAP